MSLAVLRTGALGQTGKGSSAVPEETAAVVVSSSACVVKAIPLPGLLGSRCRKAPRQFLSECRDVMAA
jgi:hypothetical protein